MTGQVFVHKDDEELALDIRRSYGSAYPICGKCGENIELYVTPVTPGYEGGLDWPLWWGHVDLLADHPVIPPTIKKEI